MTERDPFYDALQRRLAAERPTPAPDGWAGVAAQLAARRTKRRRQRLLALATLLVVLSSVGGWLYVRQQSTAQQPAVASNAPVLGERVAAPRNAAAPSAAGRFFG